MFHKLLTVDNDVIYKHPYYRLLDNDAFLDRKKSKQRHLLKYWFSRVTEAFCNFSIVDDLPLLQFVSHAWPFPTG